MLYFFFSFSFFLLSCYFRIVVAGNVPSLFFFFFKWEGSR